MHNKPQHLLDGYKMLDFTHFVAGPTTTPPDGRDGR